MQIWTTEVRFAQVGTEFNQPGNFMVSRSKVDWLTEDTIEANIKNEKIEREQQTLTQLVISFCCLAKPGKKISENARSNELYV